MMARYFAIIWFLSVSMSPISCADTDTLLDQSDGKLLQRPRRFAAIGYLTVILILLNTALLIISNVVINNNNNK